MAPAAKRRKRTILDDSEDDADANTNGNHSPQTSRNTLKRFLLSSPDTRKTADKPSQDPDRDGSPSPLPKRTTRAATKSQPTIAPSASLPNRWLKAPTKSPSTSPEKTRPRAQKKAKIDDKDKGKGKTADLVTLFSRQAQRSQATAAATTASGNQPLSSFALQDITSDPISDDDDDVPLYKASASSAVGKTAQKRFKDSSQSAVTGAALTGSINTGLGQRFLKPPSLATTATPKPAPAADDDTRPWSERFGPANLDELAVHKKKVSDVRKWLEDVLAGRMRQRLLVLKGAAGTGKTTTLRLLAKDMHCEVLEWRNPTSSYGFAQGNQGYQSASAQFEEFLGRGGKFGQLDIDSDTSPPPSAAGATQWPDRRLILIEEFPNTFMRSSNGLTAFRNTILQFLAANTPALSGFSRHPTSDPITPIVMVISETLLTTTSASADSFTAHRLLGPEILRHPGTGLIEFNAIAPTLLAKALEVVVQKEARKSGRRRTPGPLVLKRLGEIGDIRNAIASLEFLCVKGDDDTEWGSKVAFTKPKRASKDVPALTQGEQDSLLLVSQREATLGIFHAVGKVVYNKRGQSAPAGSLEAAAEMLPEYRAHLARPKLSEVNVDALIDETGTDTHTFISALHENYALSCEQSSPLDPNSSLDYINGCLDNLSESDLLCPSWDIFFGGRGAGGGFGGKDSGSHILRQDEMAFQVAVRGLLFSLPSPVKRQTHPTGRGGDSFKMFYPAYLKLWRAREELEALTDMWATKMLKGEDGVLAPSQNGLNFANGSSAFRKTKVNSVESWATGGQKRAVNTETDDGATIAPLLSLGSSARQEMVLERLPYMAHIARRRRCTFGSMRLKDLDRIVSFRGIGPPKTEESDDEQDDGSALAAEAWATDKPTEGPSSPQKKGLGAILSRSRAKADGCEAPPMLPMQSLVLSDDDIEDD